MNEVNIHAFPSKGGVGEADSDDEVGDEFALTTPPAVVSAASSNTPMSKIRDFFAIELLKIVGPIVFSLPV